MSRRQGNRGFVLITVALIIIVLCAFLGMAVDLGQMYIAKNELQSFADSAVIAAAYELDGTTAGIARAREAGLTGPGTSPNRWLFATTVVDRNRIQVLFSQDGVSGWEANPGNPVGFRFAQVLASGPVDATFMRVLRSETFYSVPAVAYAGQLSRQNCGKGTGCDPFSPDAIDLNDPDFGFEPFSESQKLYTIKWAPPGQVNNAPAPGSPQYDPYNPQNRSYCNGEQTAGYNAFETDGVDNGRSDRGYIDVGQGSGTSALHDAIVNQEYSASAPLVLGGDITVVSGNHNLGNTWSSVMQQRFMQDTDTASNTYADYAAGRAAIGASAGPPRRLLRVPINNPRTNAIIGFATFFLQGLNGTQQVCGRNNDACCAEYVGRSGTLGTAGGANDAQSSEVLYDIKLTNGGQ